jgi:hypothetical protein
MIEVTNQTRITHYIKFNNIREVHSVAHLLLSTLPCYLIGTGVDNRSLSFNTDHDSQALFSNYRHEYLISYVGFLYSEVF